MKPKRPKIETLKGYVHHPMEFGWPREKRIMEFSPANSNTIKVRIIRESDYQLLLKEAGRK